MEFNMKEFVKEGNDKFKKRTKMSKEQMYKMIGSPKAKALKKVK